MSPSRKRSQYLFHCTGQCKFSDSPIQFAVHITESSKLSPQSILKVQVNFASDTVKHAVSKCRARNLSEKARKHLKNLLETQSPSTLYNETLMLMNINRDSVGWSTAIFQKVSSKCNIDKQHDRNIIWSLLFLQNDFNKENPGTKISGYIQIIQASPFSVLAYTQEGVRIYHNMCRTQYLHLDTTGTILSMKRTMFEKAKPLLFTSCQTTKT